MRIIKENKNVEKTNLKRSSSLNTMENDEEKLYREDGLLHYKMISQNNRKERELQKFNFHNNSSICYRFGQVNVEKGLIILILQMLLTALIIYYYLFELERVMVYLYVISSGIDAILMIIFIYFIIKFRRDEIFSQFSRGLSNFVDIINTINLLFKSINYVILFFLTNELTFFFCFWFTIKFLFDVYFSFTTLKIFVFCSCTIWINEKFYRLAKWIQYYLFCCEFEDKEDQKEPEKLEELESNY